MSEASIATESLREVQPRRDGTTPRSRAATGIPGRMTSTWQTLEARLFELSDWLNPILVKETRQALKSWQFTIAFMLLLVACWVVTIGGVALIGPSIYYAAGGAELLRAYYTILSLPLLVVVPFAAFRSLAMEREDNTYDLLTITALHPRQIISGKLASAVVQMAVFFAAISPCLAFTYLLRGVDAPTILLLLVYTFFASLALSMLGLLLAAVLQQRYSQLVLSVGFVALLLAVFLGAQQFAAVMIREGYSWVSSSEFWVAQLAAASLYLTTFALAYFAAAGLITFATENRSTPLRIVMLLQQASFIGWMAFAWIGSDYSWQAIVATATIAGGYWLVMGAMLNGESQELSRRTMRSLPQSTLGRVFFTWFVPGPSSGFMFAVANLTTVLVLCLAAHGYADRFGFGRAGGIETVYCLLIGWSYVVAYLGLGCLVVALLRRFTVVTMFSSALIHTLLLLAGSGIPTCIQWMSLELQNELYSYLQITNPFWTLTYLIGYPGVPEAPVLLLTIPAAALCVLVLNLPGIVREVRRVKAPLPTRIVEDEAALHPPPEALPQNPWEQREQGAERQE